MNVEAMNVEAMNVERRLLRLESGKTRDVQSHSFSRSESCCG